jgi:predicted molibdopterin-dependent oxidoreductase YjgC
MYVMGENPMVSDPHIRHVEDGLEELDFLVVQDLFISETAELADVILPAASFAEKSGTFTNTERRIQPLSPAIDPIGQSRPDWDIVQDLSTRFGYPMDYDSVDELTQEIADVTPIYGGITPDRIDEQGLQWPCTDEDDPGTKFLHEGEFAHGKGQFHAVEYEDPDEIPDEEFPFRLSTGRMLYHFHTRTMTRRARPLDDHVPDPYVELNPEDAEEYGVEDGEMIKVASRRDEIELAAQVTDRVPEGTIFIPFHFAEAAANRLTNPALDPTAKIPELKVCAARIETLD